MTEEPVDDARIRRRLDDLRGFGAQAAHAVGRGTAAYLEDTLDGSLLRAAGRQILIQIATVVEKLPDSFKAAHTDVDWVAITRMRNLIAHHYDRVDDRLVFTALATRVPELLLALDLAR